jgi:hypothetical protein
MRHSRADKPHVGLVMSEASSGQVLELTGELAQAGGVHE